MNWSTYYGKRSFLRCLAAAVLYHWPLLQEICKCRPQRVLEMGIGSGAMTILLSRFLRLSAGMDNDQGILTTARKIDRILWTNGLFIQGDIFHPPASTPPFDVCYSQGTLEHFTDEKIREAVRVQLKLAPVVLISVPSYHYPRQDFGDERLMSLTSWLFILCEFNIVDAYYYGWNNDILIKVVR